MHLFLQLYFDEAGGQLGAIVAKSRMNEAMVEKDLHYVQCLPLGDILVAMNFTHVNYLSLDVEGLEYDVLESIPYDKIKIDYVSAEYLHVEQGQDIMIRMMQSKGYVLLEKLYHIDSCRETFVHDFVFARSE
jgi:hypothetical protein